MVETTERLLALLARLQSRREWSGPELADELGTTARTVRRDVDRLRRLGYPVASTTGVSGGYHLTTGGTAVPPLVLDRDEALAIAASLRSAGAAGLVGDADAADRVLTKLAPVLPSAVRREVGAVVATTDTIAPRDPSVAPDVLRTVTRACRDHERLLVDYRRADGPVATRTLDPHRVVTTGRRWYLVARDRDRGEWRTYRLDRVEAVRATGHRVEPVDPPDAVAFVQAAISTAPYRHQVRVEIEATIDELAALVPPTTAVLTELDDGRTLLTTGGDRLDLIAFHLLSLDRPFTVVDPDDLRTELRRVAHLATAAAR